MLWLSVSDFTETVLLHVTLNLLSQTFQLPVLRHELFLLSLEHRDHLEADLRFLFLAELDLA